MNRERMSPVSGAETGPDIREKYFEGVVVSHILEKFADDLEQIGFSPEVTEEILQALEQLPKNEEKRALAIPEENRSRFLKRLVGKPSAEVVRTLLDTARTHGYTVGYHVSDKLINQNDIVGMEKDDRDNDLPKAYYSTDYKNLYKAKKANYLYVVRAETGEHATHKFDATNQWGRASRLSIIDRLNLSDVMKEIEEQIRKENKKLH